MKASRVLAVIAVICVAVIVWYTATTGKDDVEYNAQIENSRKEKDDFMKSGEGSPFKDSPAPFTGLKYFPPNSKFRIVADLEPVENRNVMVLKTSDNKEQRYIEYAWAKFKLDGVACKLLILEVIDNGPFKGTLFLAFADQTSAIETYGAGRYLDVRKTPGASSITLDFNDAYNPYCAYNDSFSCPFPPKDNVLQVAISAGEKEYR